MGLDREALKYYENQEAYHEKKEPMCVLPITREVSIKRSDASAGGWTTAMPPCPVFSMRWFYDEGHIR